jgi:hypothetical protein
MIFYFDENLPHQLAEALNILEARGKDGVKVFSTKSIFGGGIKDEDLIPRIAEENAFLITQDINIHRTRLQYELYQKHNLGIFFLKLPKNSANYWQIVQVTIEKWIEIKDLAKNGKKPFAAFVKPKGKIELKR